MSTAAIASKSATSEAISAPVQWRDPIVTTFMTALTFIMAFTSTGASQISLSGATSWFDLGRYSIPAFATGMVLAVIALASTVLVYRAALARQEGNGWLVGIVGVAFVVTFLLWTVAGKDSSVLPVVSLLSGGLMFATPLVFGALSGVICERSGIINIAIEGQMLLGAFLGAVVASAAGTPLAALIASPLAGVLVAALLALFTIKFRADHIVVGVVLNMLVLGLTSFLFSTQLKNAPGLNKALPLSSIGIPILKDIPVIGPVLFNQTILVYLMFVAVIGLQVMLFRSRWGLRTRACGEHPKAADTVGIKVNAMRWKNVLIAGAFAGLGGAFFTVGEGLAFSKDMAAGNGFIALAAMILGRWNPKGALAAALLFGFATNLGAVMQAVGSPVPAEFLLMTPYVVTILAVAGFVGAVRAPAAEGVPYP
ncbi:ABC transporter permease [Schaalia suimastitidis]|uniref:ABC transporter permease n=1 Tax=Schaalia suimastitidis TaxID=121163 RepID=UPI000411424C|nr:ABC transporter permease [Schaalia suimastitidis]